MVSYPNGSTFLEAFPFIWFVFHCYFQHMVIFKLSLLYYFLFIFPLFLFHRPLFRSFSLYFPLFFLFHMAQSFILIFFRLPLFLFVIVLVEICLLLLKIILFLFVGDFSNIFYGFGFWYFVHEISLALSGTGLVGFSIVAVGLICLLFVVREVEILNLLVVYSFAVLVLHIIYPKIFTPLFNNDILVVFHPFYFAKGWLIDTSILTPVFRFLIGSIVTVSWSRYARQNFLLVHLDAHSNCALEVIWRTHYWLLFYVNVVRLFPEGQLLFGVWYLLAWYALLHFYIIVNLWVVEGCARMHWMDFVSVILHGTLILVGLVSGKNFTDARVPISAGHSDFGEVLIFLFVMKRCRQHLFIIILLISPFT